MTEKEMIASLQRQIELLRPTGFDLSSEDEFMYVGEWLLAFEGIYVGNKRHPNVLDQKEVSDLEDYFGVDMSDLA
jgi:hypothetical protein